MANKIITVDECAEQIWALFEKCCDAEGLDEEGRVRVLEAFSLNIALEELKNG